jgi:Ca2+-binding RTX toxin-like protein
MAITTTQAQGLVLALFGASAGGHLTGLAAASNLSTLAGDLSTSAGLILGEDLSSNTAFRDHVTANLKLTGDSLTAANAWLDGQLNAGAARGDIVATAVTFLSTLTDTTSPFYAAAQAFNTTVTAAVAWSTGAGATQFGVSALRAQQGNVDVVAGSSFVLTTGADSFVGTAGNDTISGSVTAAATVANNGDIIIDSSSTDSDVLNLTSTTPAAGDAGMTVVGIEATNFNFTTFSKPTATVTGIKSGTITVNQAQVSASPDADVTGAGNVTLVAGTGVKGTFGVTAAAASATVINAGEAATVTVTGNTTGSATVTGGVKLNSVTATAKTIAVTTAKDASSVSLIGVGTADAATISAGKAVTVSNDAAAAGGNAVVETITVSGNGVASVATLAGAAATTYKLTGASAITLATSQGAAAVSLVSGKTVTSDATGAAATEITLAAGAGETEDLTKVATKIVVKGTGHADDKISVANNATVSAAANTTTDLEINGVTATAATNVLNLAVSADQTAGITVTNTKTVNLSVEKDANIAALAAGTADVIVTGAANLTLAATSVAAKVDATAMTGVLTATADTAKVTKITGGAGDDAITLTQGVTATLDGGAGFDNLTITANGAGVASAAAATLSNFETITLADADGTQFKASQLSGKNFILKGAAGTDVLISAANTVDTLNIDLSGLIVADATHVDKITVLGTSITTNFGAANALTITGHDGVDDITGNAGDDIINGGKGNDILAGGEGKDTISGGDGADSITGGVGADTMIGGVDADTFVIADGDSATALAFDKITDFANTATNNDILDLALAFNATAANSKFTIRADVATGSDVDVKAVTTETDVVGALVKNGLMTITGAGAANVDTLSEMFEAAKIVLAAGKDGAANSLRAEVLGFEFGGNTYVVQELNTYTHAATTEVLSYTLVELTGVVSATAIAGTAAAGAIVVA